MSGDAHFGHLPVVFMTPLRNHRDASLPGIKWAVGTHEIIQDTLSRKEGGVRLEGEFFAPMPLGESRVHVADRIKGVFGTILRDASPERSNPVGSFIIVSHGVTIRCFRMRWMHYPWKWHEREKNPRNCSIQLIGGIGIQRPARLFRFDQARQSPQARREEGRLG
jgi:broad specificity phosphatase PhoE